MAKNRLNFEAHLSRHSHNVNAGYASTLTTGPIVPQYFDILGPGDTLYLEPSMFVRLQDVVTAFFGRVDVHMDAFFVPLQMLYTNFGSIFTQTDDKITSFYSESFQGQDKFPILNVEGTLASGINLRPSFFGGAECKGKEFMRLLDSFDMNPFVVLSSSNMTSSDYTQTEYDIDSDMTHCPNITPWIPCAYQAIYQKYYRNEEFERFNIRAYNFDQYYQYTADAFLSLDMFRLRYHQRLSDYFTDIRVSPIASAVNQYDNSSVGEFPDGGSSLSQVLYNINNFLNPSYTALRPQKFGSLTQASPSSSFDNVSVTERTTDSSSATVYSYLNTSAIRSLFALDKYLRIWGRAGKTYDDQILAHFGVKIPHDVKHDLTHIKHWQSSLTADPVYSTANIPLGSEGDLVSTLGQVGAQSQTTVGGSSIKFKAPVHGVFMIVAYALTKPLYECSFSKLHLLTNRLSFPIPEFDKLGAQPLYKFEFEPQNLPTEYISQICGWQNRYEEFKRKYNRCSFTFGYKSLNFHVPNVTNALAPWILQRFAFDVNQTSSNSLVSGSQLFERPDSLNSVMVRSFDTSWHPEYFQTPHLMFQSDPLITNFYANAKKVSWMSETGEPDL